MSTKIDVDKLFEENEIYSDAVIVLREQVRKLQNDLDLANLAISEQNKMLQAQHELLIKSAIKIDRLTPFAPNFILEELRDIKIEGTKYGCCQAETPVILQDTLREMVKERDKLLKRVTQLTFLVNPSDLMLLASNCVASGLDANIAVHSRRCKELYQELSETKKQLTEADEIIVELKIQVGNLREALEDKIKDLKIVRDANYGEVT